jgi:hypothetical protein
MPPCYGKIIAGCESKKLRGTLKKRIAQTVTTAACRAEIGLVSAKRRRRRINQLGLPRPAT